MKGNIYNDRTAALQSSVASSLRSSRLCGCLPFTIHRSLFTLFFRSLAALFCALTLCATADKPAFPTPFNTEDPAHIPTSPADVLANVKAPPGFKVMLAACEPKVQNPIAMTMDERGRLWVAENYTYAEKGVSFDLRLRDRILVLEDTKHDGHFDKRTVFWDGAQRLTSIEVGFGGVWALCSPQMLFIPDRNGDLVPDSEPEVLLDGWNDFEVQHNIVNGLKWGPDGWLYGRHGIQATSLVGKPGASAAERQKLNCCIWRYHPTRRVFEIVCQGTTNPWGMDWNNVGEAFFINTIIGHLWHVIPGAHFKRMYGEDFDPHVYDLIDQHADHYHWDKSSNWKDSRGTEGKASDLGGGHAHVGLMIYQGDNWPERYRNTLFTVNYHGLRLNNDLLVREGSGYVGRHAPDFLFFNDPWFRGLELLSGPDGGVYVADWCDYGDCHEGSGVHRTSGRIYKVTYETPKIREVGDIGKLSGADLVKLQRDPNVWFSRQSRRLLQERAAAGQDLSTERASLLRMYEQESDVTLKLRALWALAACGGLSEPWLLQQLDRQEESVRVWAIRLLTDEGTVSDPVLKRLVRLAHGEPSGLVRLYLASTLQKLPPGRRIALARELVARTEDANDHNMPLMLWYGIEPLATNFPTDLAGLEWQTKIPLLQKYIARRLTEDIERRPELVDVLLERVARQGSAAQQFEVLDGMALALRGWQKAPRPRSWDAMAQAVAAQKDKRLHDRFTELGAVFGDGRSIDELRRVCLDSSADPSARRGALQTLIDSQAPDVLPIVVRLLGDRIMARSAVLGLARFNDPALATNLIQAYPKFRPDVRPAVIATLASRISFARQLLDAVAAGIVPAHDLSAYDARQIYNLGDPKLNTVLTRTWGEIHVSGEDKRQQIAGWKRKLVSEQIKTADLHRGRDAFLKTCGICHRLYGEGAFIGPDLTGSGRADLDYLLENVIDPSAVVAADYRISIVQLKDDRVLTGIVCEKKEKTLTLQTPTEKVLLSRDQIDAMRDSPLSLMPEGLLDTLKEEEVNDLIAYLMTSSRP